jgi:alpha-ketoglutarate-dependent taurine dioxygenase
MRMNVELQELSGAFGVRVEGVDLHDDQPAEVRRVVHDAWLDHGLVLVRGQDLDVDEHKRFVEWFGPISTVGYAPTSTSSEKYISNTRDDGVERADLGEADGDGHRSHLSLGLRCDMP